MKQNKVPKNEYTNGEPSPYRKNPFNKDVFYGDDGQYAHRGQVTRIPGDAFGTHITMKGINEPLYARDDQGNEQMMQPGEDYTFPGQYVTEYPQMAKYGGGLLNKTLTCPKCGWSWKAADGGKDIATCHKCGGTAKLAYGGDPSLPNIEGHYGNGGTKVYTDKALYDKAHRAEMDSLNAFNNDKKWESFLKNTPSNFYNYEELYKLYEDARKRGTSDKYWGLAVREPSGSVKTDLDVTISSKDGKYTAGYSPVFKKPVIHNVYQEPVPEAVKEQPKKTEAPKKDYHHRQVDFSSPYGAVMKYYDEAGKVIREEPYKKPFGGIHSKTHTHMKEGGWLDQLEELPQAQDGLSGPNPGIDPPAVNTTASNVGSVNEDELFDQYQEYLERLTNEKERVKNVVGNVIPTAKTIAASSNPQNFLRGAGTSGNFCNAYTQQCYNIAGLTTAEPFTVNNKLYPEDSPMPMITGNQQHQGFLDEEGFVKVPLNKAQPGDTIKKEYWSKGLPWQGPVPENAVERWIPGHSMIYEGGADGNYNVYNSPGPRNVYQKRTFTKDNWQENIKNPKPNDYRMQAYHYVGKVPKYEKQVEEIKNKLYTLPVKNIEPRTMALPVTEEPELELKQDGGGSIVNYLASQGKDYSKAARQKLAEETGIKDYDFSAAKNTELLNKLQTAKAQPAPVVAKQTAPSNYMVKPIGKAYAPPSMPNYSNLSVANQATLNKLAAKDPARAKALAAQAHELDIKKKFDNLNDAEKIVERYKRVREADESERNMLDKDFWTRENWANSTQATADRLRLFPNDPNSFIDDYLNPGVLVGNMVSAIGSAPLKAKEQNSILPYFKAAAAPVVMGAFKMNPFDFVGSGAVKTVGKEVLKAGEKAVIKQGLKQAETKLPQAFGEAATVSEVEAAAIKSAKGTGQELDKITNPTYIENLRTQGFTKDAAAELQRRDIIKKAFELHGKDPKALENYVKNYTGFPSVKKFTKEYENIMTAEPVLPYRAAGKYTAKPQAPLKQKDIVQDINSVPKSQQNAAIKELQSDPLLANQPGVKNAVAGKITKKAFESTHMPIANSEQQILAKKNQVMEKLFGDTRANPTQDIGDVMKHVEAAPENSVFMGANSLSDSSFPLYALQAQRAITQGKVKPLFLGFQELNPFGHMSQSGLNPETIVAKLNQSISGFNKGLSGKAKLPNAYIKNGKVYYPNMALQKGAAEELVMEKLSRASSGYKPNIQKASGRTFSGMTREEPKAIRSKLSVKNIPYQQSEPSLLAAKTGSYALGGNWLDDLEEEYRRGGMVNPLMKSRSKRSGTSKNIQSSINKIFLRNKDLFGPGGKNIYDPKSKFEEGGGWLDNLH
jgi:hypothetical protein